MCIYMCIYPYIKNIDIYMCIYPYIKNMYSVLRDRGTEQSWQVFKDVFHRAQDLSIPKCKKSGRERKRPAWLTQEMWVKLRKKRELHRQWKQGLASWEEYREAAQLCRMGSGRPPHSWS